MSDISMYRKQCYLNINCRLEQNGLQLGYAFI